MRRHRTISLPLVLLVVGFFAACSDANPVAPPSDGGSPPPDTTTTPPTTPEIQWDQVVVGKNHTCALSTDGDVYCWGLNNWGQLGRKEAPNDCPITKLTKQCAWAPIQVSGIESVKQLTAQSFHSCALTTNGEVYCWGKAWPGPTDDSAAEPCPSSTQNGVSACVYKPHRVKDLPPIVQIDAGHDHICALDALGYAYCWGSNITGQLGTGTRDETMGPSRVYGDIRFREIRAGDYRTCALDLAGEAYCWGTIWEYRNADGREVSFAHFIPEKVPGDLRFVALEVGALTTCALTADRRLYCWEANTSGEFGVGHNDGSQIPVPAAGELRPVAFAIGIASACAIDEDGIVHCWGSNIFGQLGDWTTVDRWVPGPVTGNQRFNQIAAGNGSHVCGVTIDKEIFCWGLGLDGQLGHGKIGSAPTPTQVVSPDTN